jgi:hypothetical protein
VVLRGRAQRNNVIFFQLKDVFGACGSPRLFVKVFYSRGGNRNLVNLLFHFNVASFSKFQVVYLVFSPFYKIKSKLFLGLKF